MAGQWVNLKVQHLEMSLDFHWGCCLAQNWERSSVGCWGPLMGSCLACWRVPHSEPHSGSHWDHCWGKSLEMHWEQHLGNLKGPGWESQRELCWDWHLAWS